MGLEQLETARLGRQTNGPPYTWRAQQLRRARAPGAEETVGSGSRFQLWRASDLRSLRPSEQGGQYCLLRWLAWVGGGGARSALSSMLPAPGSGFWGAEGLPREGRRVVRVPPRTLLALQGFGWLAQRRGEAEKLKGGEGKEGFPSNKPAVPKYRCVGMGQFFRG